MIHPLRNRHRTMIATLAVLLPLLFIAGIASRKNIPASPVLPTADGIGQDMPEMQLWQSEDLWAGLDMVTALHHGGTGRMLLELRPQVYLGYPDILVYWLPGPAPGNEKIPGDALLLGTLYDTVKRMFELPAAGLSGESTVLLYSLAQQRIVASATLPALPETAGEGRP